MASRQQQSTLSHFGPDIIPEVFASFVNITIRIHDDFRIRAELKSVKYLPTGLSHTFTGLSDHLV